jgi:tetratricopeptide (TPR) repeat protein
MTKKMLTPVMRRSAPGTFITEKGGIKYFYHGGDVQGFTSDFYSTVEGGNGVVVLVNGYHVREFINEIVNSVATVYKWKDFYDPLRKNEMIVPENILSNYTGTYLFDSLLVTILKKDKDYFYISDGTYSKMHFTTEKDFYNAEFTSEKTFLIDASGSVKGFLRYLNGDTLTTAVKVNDVETLKAPFSQLGWVGWYYLENNQYENAIRYIRRSLALNPKDINGVLNLAHCYLFKNDYNEAIKLYGQFLSSDITDPNVPNKKVAVKQDFILLENKGFDKNLMNKVTADLKL